MIEKSRTCKRSLSRVGIWRAKLKISILYVYIGWKGRGIFGAQQNGSSLITWNKIVFEKYVCSLLVGCECYCYYFTAENMWSELNNV